MVQRTAKLVWHRPLLSKSNFEKAFFFLYVPEIAQDQPQDEKHPLDPVSSLLCRRAMAAMAFLMDRDTDGGGRGCELVQR